MPDHKLKSDEELFHCLQEGDAAALKLLFKKYYSTLCHFAFAFVKSTDLAQEAVSDVFLHIWLRKKDIQIRTNLKTYIYTAVRNRCIQYLRHRGSRFFEDMETAGTDHMISDLNADRLVSFEELKDDIEALLRHLPEKRQIIFRMNRLDGLSYQEIADILSISVHTVQNQMTAAVKFIAQRHRPER